MQHREGTRRMRRVGACLAFISSILVLTLATPAAADEVDAGGYGHFSIQLTGKEVPPGGDPEGQGYARLDLDPEHETACFDIQWKKLDGAVTAFHLHAAPRGSEGPHWIDLFNGKHFTGARNTVSGCVHVDASHGMSPRDKIRAVIHNPSGFYLNVHSTKFEDGAIRGQLGQLGGGPTEAALNPPPSISAPVVNPDHVGQTWGGGRVNKWWCDDFEVLHGWSIGLTATGTVSRQVQYSGQGEMLRVFPEEQDDSVQELRPLEQPTTYGKVGPR